MLDDNEPNRLLLADLLRRRGFAADTAATATAALELAQARPPDLLITDLRMPDVCGYAAAWQVRSATGRPDLPVVAASASPLPEPGAAAALGFDGFVLKPIEPTQLYSVLGRCLRLRWTSANSTVEPPAMPVASAAACPAALSDQPQRAWPLLPGIELEAGAELAEHGDWSALRDWCAELACSDPSYEAFATRVLDLVAALEHGDRKAEGRALLDLLAGRER